MTSASRAATNDALVAVCNRFDIAKRFAGQSRDGHPIELNDGGGHGGASGGRPACSREA